MSRRKFVCGNWKMHKTSAEAVDRKSTRLNSSHSQISYAVFCLKKKNQDVKGVSSFYYSRSHYNQLNLPNLIYASHRQCLPELACDAYHCHYIVMISLSHDFINS